MLNIDYATSKTSNAQIYSGSLNTRYSALANLCIAGIVLIAGNNLTLTEPEFVNTEKFTQDLKSIVLKTHTVDYNKATSLYTNASFIEALTGAKTMESRHQVIKTKINKTGYQKHILSSTYDYGEVFEENPLIDYTLKTKKIKVSLKKMGYIPHVIDLSEEEV